MPMLSFWLKDFPILRVLLIVLGALFVCRLLAATILPCLCEKRRYLLLGIGLLLLVPPLEYFIGEPYGLSETIFIWFLLSPFFILGAIGIVRRFRWYHVLLSCVLELLLLPIWFIIVFTIGLCFEGDDDMASVRPSDLRNPAAIQVASIGERSESVTHR